MRNLRQGAKKQEWFEWSSPIGSRRGGVSGQRLDNVSHNVNMESLGHCAAQRADIVRPVAAVASAPSTRSETRIDGVSLKHLSDAAIALGFKGLGAKVDRITVDGVPVKYLSDEAQKMLWPDLPESQASQPQVQEPWEFWRDYFALLGERG